MTQEARALHRGTKLARASIPFDETPLSIAILLLVMGIASTAGASTFALRGIDARNAAPLDVPPGLDAARQAPARGKVDASTSAANVGPTSADGASESHAPKGRRLEEQREAGMDDTPMDTAKDLRASPPGQASCHAIELSFAPSSTTLGPEEKEVVVRLARWLMENDTRVLVEGHADARGRVDVNLWLSHERASSVASMLSAHGVARSRLVVRAFGAYQPVPFASETDERQRRVVIHVSPEHGCPPPPRVPIEP